jgi:alkanesulfonate monooxygenase SsuD/methylene tetrahydromethanopterin reductase-like flavin-dependent oxidoreductase (luciferase family)
MYMEDLMELGLIYELQVPDWESPESVRQGFLDALDQVELGEKLGWTHVWAVEHHNLPGWSSSSAPEVLFGAISQRTTTMRIGHGIALLPKNFNHPFRVAERAATLDLISGGRVELGTGRAVTLQELEGFEVPPDETQAQWKEALEIIVQSFGYDPVQYKGDYYDIPPTMVVPKPYQQPHPPLWLSGTNPETFEKAGKYGLGMLAFLTEPPEAVVPRIALYKEAIKNATPIGKFVNEKIALMVQTYCAETREQAFEDAGAAVAIAAERISALFLPWAERKPKQTAASYDYLTSSGQDYRPETMRAGGESGNLEERVNNASLAIGSPDDVIRVMRAWEDTGVNQLLTWIQFGGMPQEKILSSMKLIGEHVIPELKKPRVL